MSEHLDPKYDEHSEESRRSHRHRSRRSSTIPSALWLILGALVALLIVLAVRGPSTVVVQSNGCGCCCDRGPCEPVGAAETPIRGDRIGQTPAIPPVPPLPAPETSSPCCNGPQVANRTTPGPIVPFWPWRDNGGGGGTNGGNGGGNGPTEIPEPGPIALILAGAAALRPFV
jgi:hypothetical protein